MKIIFFLLFAFLISKNLNSEEFPKIFGCFCQGGLILGKINNNSSIKIDTKNVEIFPNGEFIFAFDRNFKEEVSIEINNVSKKFKIKKKKYKIEKIRGLPKKKVDPSKEDLVKIKKDQKRISEAKKMGKKNKLFDNEFIIPVEGRLSGFFGSQRVLNDKPRKPHYGIDIAQSEGSIIKAPSSGIIKVIAANMFFTGNTVIIDHGLGLISIFAHMKEINVLEGQLVKKNDIIGTVGMTGRATGPHLHWGVYYLKTPVDPLSLVEYTFF